MSKLIFNELKKDLDARNAKGFKTYKKPMRAFDGKDTIMDIFEELLDALVYIKKFMIERDKKLTKK